MHATEYRSMFKDELQRDYPHVFGSIDLSNFQKISEFGERLVAIHTGDSEPISVPSIDLLGSFGDVIERPLYKDETIWLNRAESFGFSGITSMIWNIEIGGYKICEKWLKDRKGRKLSSADCVYFVKVLWTLNETLNIQGQIDDVVKLNGGWKKTFEMPIV